jgi:hypothetical protein
MNSLSVRLEPSSVPEDNFLNEYQFLGIIESGVPVTIQVKKIILSF